jgi:hypothetical protein
MERLFDRDRLKGTGNLGTIRSSDWMGGRRRAAVKTVHPAKPEEHQNRYV